MTGTSKDSKSPSSRRRQTAPRQNGAAVLAIRQKDGRSQTKIAAAIGITQGALSQIESERVSADRCTLMAIARELGVAVDALLRNPGTWSAGAPEQDEPDPLPAAA